MEDCNIVKSRSKPMIFHLFKNSDSPDYDSAIFFEAVSSQFSWNKNLIGPGFKVSLGEIKNII